LSLISAPWFAHPTFVFSNLFFFLLPSALFFRGFPVPSFFYFFALSAPFRPVSGVLLSKHPNGSTCLRTPPLPHHLFRPPTGMLFRKPGICWPILAGVDSMPNTPTGHILLFFPLPTFFFFVVLSGIYVLVFVFLLNPCRLVFPPLPACPVSENIPHYSFVELFVWGHAPSSDRSFSPSSSWDSWHRQVFPRSGIQQIRPPLFPASYCKERLFPQGPLLCEPLP